MKYNVMNSTRGPCVSVQSNVTKFKGLLTHVLVFL